MSMMASCLSCKRIFMSNPNYVPSLNGEPVCQDCVKAANEERKRRGTEPHFIHPLAYEPEEVG